MFDKLRRYDKLTLIGHYDSYVTSDQIPQITPTTIRRSTTITAATMSLNFLYLFLSVGAKEPCGKYGGGVYVAI